MYKFYSYSGQIVQEIHFIFVEPVKGHKVSLRFRGYVNQPFTEWEVVLYGIPLSNQGKEVVVTWWSPNIEHNQTFYTDSNGLAM